MPVQLRGFRPVLLSFLLVTNVANAQSQTQASSNADVAAFFLWRTKRQYHPNEVEIYRVRRKIIAWDGLPDIRQYIEDTLEYNGINRSLADTLLMPACQAYMMQQIRDDKNIHSWTKKLFPRVEFVFEPDLSTIQQGEEYWQFSLPLFTPHKNYCLVRENYICGGLCASWSLILYQRSGPDTWKVASIFEFGQS